MRISMGTCTALTITFVVLKALGYIDWAWWIIFSPLWGYAAFGLILIVLVLIFGMAVFSWPDIVDWLEEHFYFKL